MLERTCALIKPDAVAVHNVGRIIAMIEDHGFTILRLEKMKLSKERAQHFYAVHKDRSFFGELVDFMSSGPIIAIALEKENAIADWRKLMGATDPSKADLATVRRYYGKNVGENAVHGSDAAETAAVELPFFFPDLA